ncbi:integral membrane sensor signal transduction histidine kinase [Parvibaculum lavamentivorans DS-1]|uniref:histidine kinase n=1 Tax=Parvibaculum lavamentivorans (strain DS-1 / DSM 13023 / NCIMB 13966) TaxID=402881 RepID=A7HPU5_PARL1|nr:HAMP domain-containing sensor histidine kinase [Parvibaculum lavamentivorans]ABS61928.1 integral membrane sensor signal transduction histidine kinase [Parvibaculum lavamentivorans DS-1]
MRATAEGECRIGEGWWRRLSRPLRGSLSRRLLVLTILFVMLAEVLIFVPSVANFRLNWLDQRLAAAQIASLALEARPDNMVSPALREELLKNAQVYAVALRRDDARRLVLSEDMPPMVDTSFDLRDAMAMRLVMDAFETLLAGDGRIVLVTGNPHFGAGESIEIVLDETPLRRAMLRYSKNIFLLSFVISIITASLVFVVLHFVLVRPMRRITENMVAFRDNPEDARRVMAPSLRADEIGVAERELSVMQKEIRATLSQKAHLASLGVAVSKINHDLRNILASAQLISDRLGAVDDPTVQHLAPRLFASIDRAIDLCTNSLKFGRAEETAPQRRRIPLASFADEVAEAAWPDHELVRWVNDVPADLEVDADPDQLFRILLNLTRNAAQALTDGQAGHARGGEMRIAAHRAADHIHIDLSDTGPGLPAKAREHLFEPFSGGTRADGTGLGLAIAAELARMHGGHIELLKSDASGTTFRICIPDDAGTPHECAEAEGLAAAFPQRN